MKWFGEPWPSGICYDDEGRLLSANRVDYPLGRSCGECETRFGLRDSGVRIPGHDGTVWLHKECLLRVTLGCAAHLEGRPHDHTVSVREDALAVWEWVRERVQHSRADLD